MKQNKNKKKWTAAAAALAIIAALAGTFAWFTSQDSTKNHFETDRAGNDTEIVETFNPPKDWQPGQVVNKDVAVQNNGNFNSLIRVSLSEMIDRYATAKVVTVDQAGVDKLNAGTDQPKTYELFTFEGDLTDYKEATVKDADGQPVTHQIKVTQKDKSEETLNLYVFEKKNTSANVATGNAFQYQAYWAASKDATVKYFAKTGPLKRTISEYEADGKTEKTGYVTLEQNPQVRVYDAARVTGNTDWRQAYESEPGAYQLPSTVTPDTSGNVSITSRLENGQEITLQFNNVVEKTKADQPAAQGKWAYNELDGYFYYIGIVPPQGQTSQLLDSVTLGTDAGNEYAGMKYDLTVHSEGIQALAEAAKSAQWLNEASATTPSTIFKGLDLAGFDDPNI